MTATQQPAETEFVTFITEATATNAAAKNWTVFQGHIGTFFVEISPAGRGTSAISIRVDRAKYRARRLEPGEIAEFAAEAYAHLTGRKDA